MCAGDSHQHDRIGWPQHADAMDHENIDHLPARAGLSHDFLERLFGHPRVVLQGHAGDVATFVHIAHQTDEACDSADRRIVLAQSGNLSAQLEFLGLDAHCHISHP